MKCVGCNCDDCRLERWMWRVGLSIIGVCLCHWLLTGCTPRETCEWTTPPDIATAPGRISAAKAIAAEPTTDELVKALDGVRLGVPTAFDIGGPYIENKLPLAIALAKSTGMIQATLYVREPTDWASVKFAMQVQAETKCRVMLYVVPTDKGAAPTAADAMRFARLIEQVAALGLRSPLVLIHHEGEKFATNDPELPNWYYRTAHLVWPDCDYRVYNYPGARHLFGQCMDRRAAWPSDLLTDGPCWTAYVCGEHEWLAYAACNEAIDGRTGLAFTGLVGWDEYVLNPDDTDHISFTPAPDVRRTDAEAQRLLLAMKKRRHMVAWYREFWSGNGREVPQVTVPALLQMNGE